MTCTFRVVSTWNTCSPGAPCSCSGRPDREVHLRPAAARRHGRTVLFTARPGTAHGRPRRSHALRRLPPVSDASADFGEFFEHFVFLELRAWIDYRKPRTPLAYWRSRSGYEVDFILDDRVSIEAKATRRVQRKHLRSLRALAEERLVERCIVVCREERPRVEDGIEIWPLEFFLTALWDDGL